MKTKSHTLTLASFCEQSHLSPKLVRAVVRQMGGWESFARQAPDISSHGVDGGYSGFIYTSEMETFAKRNHEEISKMAREQAEDFGTGVIEMIRSFGCFRHCDPKPSDGAIGKALYAGRDSDDGWAVLKALAWYAGEEVARSYTAIAERK